jgi:hypothetical protein
VQSARDAHAPRLRGRLSGFVSGPAITGRERMLEGAGVVGIYVAQPERATSGTTMRATFKGKFSMIPWEVGADERLRPSDVRVYFVLSACRRKEIASVGTRRIGESIGMGRNRVAESIRRLAKAGHIEVGETGRGKRPIYRLTAAIFAKEEKLSPRSRPDTGRRGKVVRSSVVSAAAAWARTQEEKAQEIA